MPKIDVGSITAAGHARLHVGDVHNTVTNKNYQYSLRTRESDDTLRGDQRNATLIRAAAEGQTPRVQYLIRRGVDVDHTDQHGLTALHHAVYCGFDDTVALLIDEGADVNARSFQCGTPLHLAVLNGRMSTLNVLRDNRADASAKCRLFGTALHLACHAGDLELCHVLLERNREAQLAQLAEVSLATGALRCNLNELNELEVQVTIACSPLHIVAKLGHLSLAKMLLASGANINAVDEAGYSATMYALRDRHFDVMQELLSQGAVPTRMRILESQIIPGDDGGLETTMRPPGSAPDRPYAVLLHADKLNKANTFEQNDCVGVWYRDRIDDTILRSGVGQALKDGIDCLWEETWCVEATDPDDDISENTYLSRVRLESCVRCYVYLSDVRDVTDVQGFDDSAWFTRPESVASLFLPRQLEFFARNWDSLGTREKLAPRIAHITKISPAYLCGRQSWKDASAACKLSWIAGTAQDALGGFAYAVMWLFSIILRIREADARDFGVHWLRLQATIFKNTMDYSIFAWKGAAHEKGGLHLLPITQCDSMVVATSRGLGRTGLNNVSTPPAVKDRWQNFSSESLRREAQSGLRVSSPSCSVWSHHTRQTHASAYTCVGDPWPARDTWSELTVAI